MLKINKAPSEGICSKCASYQKQIAKLKRAFIEADDKNVIRSLQHEDKILDLTYERSYTYRLLKDYEAEIGRLKAEHSSGNQSKKMVLEEVGQPESNTNLCAPSSVKGDENEH